MALLNEKASLRKLRQTGEMGYEMLIVEHKGRVGWLINNRPDQLNAMNSKMREEFAEADIVIAASDTQFFDPQVSVGQVVALEARQTPSEVAA